MLMIARIEIDGFKSFNEFALDLDSLTIIAGPKGSGKSNLFDALSHLSRLADKTLVEAFTSKRGSYAELFSLMPDGSRADTISYAVEMLLPERVTDEFSVAAEIQQRRLRYELKIRMEDSPQRGSSSRMSASPSFRRVTTAGLFAGIGRLEGPFRS